MENLSEGWLIFFAIIGALGGLGGVGGLITAIVVLRKTSSDIRVSSKTAEKIDAEASDVIGKAYRALLDKQKEAYNERYDAQGELTEALRARIRALETENKVRDKQHDAELVISNRRIADLEDQLEKRDQQNIEHVKKLEKYVRELREAMEHAGLKVPPLPDWFKEQQR